MDMRHMFFTQVFKPELQTLVYCNSCRAIVLKQHAPEHYLWHLNNGLDKSGNPKSPAEAITAVTKIYITQVPNA